MGIYVKWMDEWNRVKNKQIKHEQTERMYLFICVCVYEIQDLRMFVFAKNLLGSLYQKSQGGRVG